MTTHTDRISLRINLPCCLAPSVNSARLRLSSLERGGLGQNVVVDAITPACDAALPDTNDNNVANPVSSASERPKKVKKGLCQC